MRHRVKRRISEADAKPRSKGRIMGRMLDAEIVKHVYGEEVVWEDPTGFDWACNYGPCYKDKRNGDGERKSIPWFHLKEESLDRLLRKVEEEGQLERVFDCILEHANHTESVYEGADKSEDVFYNYLSDKIKKITEHLNLTYPNSSGIKELFLISDIVSYGNEHICHAILKIYKDKK